MAKTRIVCYLRRAGIEIYPDHLDAPIYFAFSPDVVKNLEVLNDDVLETQFLDTIEKINIKKADFVFLLADDILFTKDIAVAEPEKMKTELETFMDLVPVAPELRIQGKRSTDTTVTHFVLNKALYIHLVKALQRIKYQVLAVVPTYGLNLPITETQFGQAPSLPFDSIDKVISSALQAKSENVLLQEPKPEAQPKQLAGVSFSMQVDDKRKLVLTIVFILMCMLVAGIAMYTVIKPFLTKPKPIYLSESPAPVAPVATEVPVASEEPVGPQVPTNEARKAMKIQIVNASGTPGQAKKVQDLLAPLGYENFTTGNATAAATQSATTVQFKASVQPEIKVEVETSVRSLFPGAVRSELPETENFDVVITTLK